VIVFLPGAAGSGAFWAPVTERLPGRTMDLPGLGEIPSHRDIRSYDDLSDHVARTLSGPSAIVAQSMGAYIALRLALRDPGLVSHLILTAATGGVGAANYGATDWRADYEATYPYAQPWARGRVHDFSDEDLETIAIPTLLIWATRDPLSPLPVAKRLASSIPNATLVTFDSDDHWFVHQYPERVALLIRALLRAADEG